MGLLLGVSVLYLTKVHEPARKAEAQKGKVFAGLDAGAIQTIRVTPAKGNGFYELLRHSPEEGAEWTISDLPLSMVDLPIARGIVDSLRNIELEGPLEEKKLSKDFSVYGMNEPELTVEMGLRGGESKEVAFGRKIEYLQKRYCKVTGKPGLYLADESTFGSLNRSRSDIRAKKPVVFIDDDVREVKVESANGVVRVVQPIVGQWTIEERGGLEASAKGMKDLLQSVRMLEVKEFVDGADERSPEYGVWFPRARITLKLKEGSKPESIEVSVSGPRPGTDSAYFSIKGVPTIFKMDQVASGAFDRELNDLREKKLVKVQPLDIAKLSSSGSADAAVEVVATNTDWTVNGKTSDPVFVEQLLNDITNLEAVDFPSKVPEDAVSLPFVSLTVALKTEGADPIVITVGKETEGTFGKGRYVKVSSLKDVVIIRDVEAKRIVPHEGALIQRPTPQPSPAGEGAVK